MVRITREIPPGLSSLLKSVLVSVVVVVGYFILPFPTVPTLAAAVFLAIGIVVVAILLVWQIRAIIVSRHPRVKATGALSLTAPLFLMVFAITYYVMGNTAEHQHFSEPLTRLDALYLVLTIFVSPVFGDIVPVSQPARAVVTGQILGNVVLLGLITYSVQAGLARRERR